MIIIKDYNETIGVVQARADVLVIKDKAGGFCIAKNRFGKTGSMFRDLASVGTFLHNQEQQNRQCEEDHEEEKASALIQMTTNSNEIDLILEQILSS